MADNGRGRGVSPFRRIFNSLSEKLQNLGGHQTAAAAQAAAASSGPVEDSCYRGFSSYLTPYQNQEILPEGDPGSVQEGTVEAFLGDDKAPSPSRTATPTPSQLPTPRGTTTPVFGDELDQATAALPDSQKEPRQEGHSEPQGAPQPETADVAESRLHGNPPCVGAATGDSQQEGQPQESQKAPPQGTESHVAKAQGTMPMLKPPAHAIKNLSPPQPPPSTTTSLPVPGSNTAATNKPKYKAPPPPGRLATNRSGTAAAKPKPPICPPGAAEDADSQAPLPQLPISDAAHNRLQSQPELSTTGTPADSQAPHGPPPPPHTAGRADASSGDSHQPPKAAPPKLDWAKMIMNLEERVKQVDAKRQQELDELLTMRAIGSPQHELNLRYEQLALYTHDLQGAMQELEDTRQQALQECRGEAVSPTDRWEHIVESLFDRRDSILRKEIDMEAWFLNVERKSKKTRVSTPCPDPAPQEQEQPVPQKLSNEDKILFRKIKNHYETIWESDDHDSRNGTNTADGLRQLPEYQEMQAEFPEGWLLKLLFAP